MSNPLTSFIFNAILIISANSMAMNSFTVGTLPSERKLSAARFLGNALSDAGWELRVNRGVYPALQDSRGRPSVCNLGGTTENSSSHARGEVLYFV